MSLAVAAPPSADTDMQITGIILYDSSSDDTNDFVAYYDAMCDGDRPSGEGELSLYFGGVQYDIDARAVDCDPYDATRVSGVSAAMLLRADAWDGGNGAEFIGITCINQVFCSVYELERGRGVPAFRDYVGD